MKKIGIVAVSAITLCWAMYEVSSDNTNTALRNESNQKSHLKEFHQLQRMKNWHLNPF